MRLLFLSLVSILFLSKAEAITPQDVPIFPCAQNLPHSKKDPLAICSMFKNEAAFLREWIEYHLLVGATHFYLYNNCSTDEFRKVLTPYITLGIVELFEVPFDSTPYNDRAKTHNLIQVCCYNHAINQSKNTAEWLAIIDSDEFICPIIKDNIPAILKRYEYAPGLAVYWQIFGTSNVWDLAPGELLIEKLLWKFPKEEQANWQHKSIVRPKYATCKSPHSCFYSKHHAVDPYDQLVASEGKCPPVDIIRINHYCYRTESFYYRVKKPRRWDWGYRPTLEDTKAELDRANSTYDDTMLRFVPALQKRMKKPPKEL